MHRACSVIVAGVEWLLPIGKPLLARIYSSQGDENPLRIAAEYGWLTLSPCHTCFGTRSARVGAKGRGTLPCVPVSRGQYWCGPKGSGPCCLEQESLAADASPFSVLRFPSCWMLGGVVQLIFKGCHAAQQSTSRVAPQYRSKAVAAGPAKESALRAAARTGSPHSLGRNVPPPIIAPSRQ